VLDTVTIPPLVTVTPGAMDAVLVATPTFTPTAAATATEPSLSCAFGGVVWLEASLLVASDPAWSPAVCAAAFCPDTCWSTLDPLLEVPSLLAGAPPATLAVALALLSELDTVPTLTAPVAVRLRPMVAVTVSVSVVRARLAPTATLFPCVVPVAVLLADAVWLAVLE
jgi:hypothetical protein